MKITKSQLRQIIKEEVDKVMNQDPLAEKRRSMVNTLRPEFARYDVRYDKKTKQFYDERDGEPLTPEEVKLRIKDYDEAKGNYEKKPTSFKMRKEPIG
tara:strand:- start:115 stop:408 length:294 start_codon:yes stop_codon:yes gene_type:complete